MQISNNRKDADHIRFILIGYEEYNKQLILAKYDMHIYDMLKVGNILFALERLRECIFNTNTNVNDNKQLILAKYDKYITCMIP